MPINKKKKILIKHAILKVMDVHLNDLKRFALVNR